MKTKDELNADILKITTKIKQSYPELLKYLNEMSVTIPYLAHPEIDIKALEDYYNSLETLVKDYALSHKTDRK